jgi:hypothetical protein
MEFNECQISNLGTYLLDISKLIVAIYVFTSSLDKPLMLVLGLICALLFLIGGLVVLKGAKK